jgi:hypothetical protein
MGLNLGGGLTGLIARLVADWPVQPQTGQSSLGGAKIASQGKFGYPQGSFRPPGSTLTGAGIQILDRLVHRSKVNGPAGPEQAGVRHGSTSRPGLPALARFRLPWLTDNSPGFISSSSWLSGN